MAKVGRSTKLTEELIEQISIAVENGSSNKDACILTGISESTFYNWMNEAKALQDKKKIPSDKRIYLEFMESLKKAEAMFKQFHLGQINKASREGSWQASAWMLERKYPNEYSRKLELRGQDGNAPELVKIYIPDNGRE